MILYNILYFTATNISYCSAIYIWDSTIKYSDSFELELHFAPLTEQTGIYNFFQGRSPTISPSSRMASVSVMPGK